MTPSQIKHRKARSAGGSAGLVTRAGEAVEIGFENRPAAGRKLAHGVAAAHRAGEHDLACLTLRYELISTEGSRRLVSRNRSRGLPRSCSFAKIGASMGGVDPNAIADGRPFPWFRLSRTAAPPVLAQFLTKPADPSRPATEDILLE
jgi:hypothetical protein